MAITAQLKTAVNDAVESGRETRYSIAKNAGLDYASFIRWLDEDRDIRASTIDKLASYFGLSLTETQERKPRKK
jgi:hypothetical protein